MFHGPDEIPAKVDCVALANTGVDALIPLLIGLAIVGFGIAFFALSRGRLRKSGIALGLVLLLAGGGAGLALVAPASSASADDCTPLDYSIDAFLNTEGSVNPGTDVTLSFWIVNVVDRDGTTPIVVTIPKDAIHITVPTLGASANWTLDTSDLTNYVFTYTGPLPKGTQSSDALFNFKAGTNSCSPINVPITATIVTGSGGDTNPANNSVVVDLGINAAIC